MKTKWVLANVIYVLIRCQTQGWLLYIRDLI